VVFSSGTVQESVTVSEVAGGARRWKRGASQVPKAAQMILSGYLGQLYAAWSGWTLRDDKLISPEAIVGVTCLWCSPHQPGTIS
jgi:hypothetical protein